MRSRAYRRAQRRRILHKRYHQMNCYTFRADDAFDDRITGIALDTPKRCSCPMCGNPRRYFKTLTMQEYRQVGRLKRVDLHRGDCERFVLKNWV